MRTIQDGWSDGMIDASVQELQTTFVQAIPRIVTALLFLAAAYVAIGLLLRVIGSALGRLYANDDLIADLFATVAAIFLWFAAALALLKILGMGEVAASLGTATGFVALGVSYALSNMIADTVAGVYLLRDPDFNPGDRVETADVTGTVLDIELRKTRFETEAGDVVVVGNGAVEKKWTKKASGSGVPRESAMDEEIGTSE